MLHPPSTAEPGELTLPVQPPVSDDPTQRITVIRPTKGWLAIDLQEMWRYRELLFFLAWRDVKIRYKQTVFGVGWAVIQPVMTMVVFSLFFGKLASIPSDGVPYPVFSLAALVPWTFFASGITQSANSLVGSQHLIKKVYFPRLIIPLSNIFTGLVDFGIAFLVLIGMCLAFHIEPTRDLLWLPLFLVLALVTALGTGLWLSALNVQFRDVRYTLPFLTQLWLFATPIAYPSSLVPEKWQVVYALNPMVGVVEGFRWALLGTETAPGPMVLVSSIVALTLLATGIAFFRRMEKTFADVL